MSQFEYKSDIYNKSFHTGDFMKFFFKSQDIESYLPLKSEIVKDIKQPCYEGNFKIWNYAMPYDIEGEHIKKHRDIIRSLPVEFKWAESELIEYDSLPNDDLKRQMILDKVDMKSIYLPNLKYEKDFIEYPPLPSDEKSKNDFIKGYELYNSEDEETKTASIIYLEKSAESSNYKARELLSRYYFSKIKNMDKIDNFSWENISKNFINHCEWLVKHNLSAGYYLMSEYYSYYIGIKSDSLSSNEINKIYDENIYPNMVKALETGSYDLMYKLAVYNSDLEWALCAMILTGKSEIFNRIANNSEEGLPVNPRNMAILKLAVMLGSHKGLGMFIGNDRGLFEEGFFDSLFFQDVTKDFNYSMLNTCNDLVETKNLCRSYVYKDSFLIHDIDKFIPPSTVLYTPYSTMTTICYYRDKHYSKYLREAGYYKDPDNFPKAFDLYIDFPYKDPRSKYSTLENKKMFRRLMSEYDSRNALDNEWLNKPEQYDTSNIIHTLIERSKNSIISNEIYEYLGYCNALKKRELDMNPHYYKLARPYIFPEEVYKERPDWY